MKAWEADASAGGIMMWSLEEVDGVEDVVSNPNLVHDICAALNYFDADQPYVVGDKVHFEGVVYIAVNENSPGGIRPTESPWFWRPKNSFDGNLFPGAWY